MTDAKPVPIGLVGIGGYADSYLQSIETLEKENLATLASVVIRTPGKYPVAEKRVAARGIPIRATFEEMLEKDRGKIEIAAIPTGIDSHRRMMIQAVEAGLNVVLEKPPTATIQDFDAMEDALRRTGRFCAIGFQNQSRSVIRGLKRDICAGKLGQIRDVVVIGTERRDEQYYRRNSWAGKFMSNGGYILDGTINNPLAHYLFNGLFFAHAQPGRAAFPVSVRAELYHGHNIESEDTSCLEIQCDNGVKVYFYATLCAQKNSPIVVQVFGDKLRAVIQTGGPAKYYAGDAPAGEVPDTRESGQADVFRNAVRFHRGAEPELNCPLAMTRAHVLAVNGAFASAGRPATVPAAHIKPLELPEAPGHVFATIIGIEDLIARAAKERKLFSDLGVPWAVRTKAFPLKRYKQFSL
jgi:predicted dehydrogenase